MRLAWAKIRAAAACEARPRCRLGKPAGADGERASASAQVPFASNKQRRTYTVTNLMVWDTIWEVLHAGVVWCVLTGVGSCPGHQRMQGPSARMSTACAVLNSCFLELKPVEASVEGLGRATELLDTDSIPAPVRQKRGDFFGAVARCAPEATKGGGGTPPKCHVFRNAPAPPCLFVMAPNKHAEAMSAATDLVARRHNAVVAHLRKTTTACASTRRRARPAPPLRESAGPPWTSADAQRLHCKRYERVFSAGGMAQETALSPIVRVPVPDAPWRPWRSGAGLEPGWSSLSTAINACALRKFRAGTRSGAPGMRLWCQIKQFSVWAGVLAWGGGFGGGMWTQTRRGRKWSDSRPQLGPVDCCSARSPALDSFI